jgi:broad specificity phosphatase PhoE
MKREKPTNTAALHVVHLIRHGQYVLDRREGGGALTALGRAQSSSAGQHLRRWPIERIWASDLPRAVETAEIIAGQLKLSAFQRSGLLREVMPTAVPGQRVPLAARREAKLALERVVERFLVPVRTPRQDLLVCHGILIRSLVCRVLGTPATSWLRLATYHCALTTVVVAADGGLKLVRYGESAYLSDELLTSQ